MDLIGQRAVLPGGSLPASTGQLSQEEFDAKRQQILDEI